MRRQCLTAPAAAPSIRHENKPSATAPPADNGELPAPPLSPPDGAETALTPSKLHMMSAPVEMIDGGQYELAFSLVNFVLPVCASIALIGKICSPSDAARKTVPLASIVGELILE